MEVPQGLKDVPKGHVLKLIKALYRLRQAGRQWYNTLRKVLEKFGMKRVESDPHTFVVTKVINREKKTLIIPIYVDDLFPFGDKVLTDNFEVFIPDYFETTPPCDAHYFLGICVTLLLGVEFLGPTQLSDPTYLWTKSPSLERS